MLFCWPCGGSHHFSHELLISLLGDTSMLRIVPLRIYSLGDDLDSVAMRGRRCSPFSAWRRLERAIRAEPA